MNILDSAYRIGQLMKTISIGSEWIELYSQLSESISPEAWDTFLKTPRASIHYYSFPHALEVIENNSTRTDIPEILQGQLQELKASPSLKRLSELSVTLGNNLEEMISSALAPRPIPKNFGLLQASPKLSRSIQDIHLAFQRSGILKSILRYIDPKTNEFPSIVNTFNQQKKSLSNHMNPKIRKLVRNLGAIEGQQKLLTVMSMSELILEITKQMVFESHLKRVVNIPSESIVRSVVKNVSGIRPVYLNLDVTMLSQINGNGHFMTVWLAGATQTAIMTRRRIQFGQKASNGFKMTMNGYLYPESDVSLLDQLID